VICVAIFISATDMTMVTVALPDMSSDLDAGIGELQWMLAAYLLTTPWRPSTPRPAGALPSAWRFCGQCGARVGRSGSGQARHGLVAEEVQNRVGEQLGRPVHAAVTLSWEQRQSRIG
jgi:MFS family permease